jgi:hypothetical protein
VPSARMTWTRQGWPGVGAGHHFGQSHKFADGIVHIVGAKWCGVRILCCLLITRQDRLCKPDSSAARHPRDEWPYASLQHNPRRLTKSQGERHRAAEAYVPCGVEWKK